MASFPSLLISHFLQTIERPVFLFLSGVWFLTARANKLQANGEDPPPSSVPPGGYSKHNWFAVEVEVSPDEQAVAEKLQVSSRR